MFYECFMGAISSQVSLNITNHYQYHQLTCLDLTETSKHGVWASVVFKHSDKDPNKD